MLPSCNERPALRCGAFCCHDTCASVLVMTDTETPRRSVRVPDERWDRFGEIAAEQGTNASAKLNSYMQTEIDNHKGAAKS